jgi:hypothetical protein
VKQVCQKCKGTLWVCENHSDQVAHECNYCGGAGEPCECNPEAKMPPGTTIIFGHMNNAELDDFITHAESNFVPFAMVFGEGFLHHAILIAKELRDARAERQKILDFIDEFRGSEKERHSMFSEGYDYALHQIEQVMGVADEQPRD